MVIVLQSHVIAEKIVGAILCDKETYPDSKAMLELSFSPRTSRLLEEDNLDVSKREVLLVRRSLAWITGVILLVSTFIGVRTSITLMHGCAHHTRGYQSCCLSVG